MRWARQLGIGLLAVGLTVSPVRAAPDRSPTFLEGLTHYDAGAPAAAERVWRPAAEAGDPWAQYGLGLLADPMTGLSDADADRAVAWFARAAAREVAPARLRLELLLRRRAENGAPADPGAALAEGDEVAAALDAARAREAAGPEGRGAPAVAWYQLAAELGAARGLGAADTAVAAGAAVTDPGADTGADPGPPTQLQPPSEPPSESLADPIDLQPRTASSQRPSAAFLDLTARLAGAPQPAPEPAPETDAQPQPAPENEPAARRLAEATGLPGAGRGSDRHYAVQLGALETADAARRERTRLRQLFPELLGHRPVLVEPGARHHRLRTTGRLTLTEAWDLCRPVQDAGQPCMIVPQD
jgi:cell division septation protein DedD